MTTESAPAETFAKVEAEELPPPHWVARAAFPLLVLVFAANQLALTFAVSRDLIWLAIPLALLTSHLMHGFLIGFHEASHGMLRKSRLLNEIDGIILGTLSFMSFSLYRAAHQSHHAYLASERDEEFWPFVHPSSPRWFRRVAAFLELNAGLIFTPIVFLRIFLRKGSRIRSQKVRRRVWQEFALIVIVWTLALTGVWYFHAWKYFFWVHLGPAFLAGNLQSWRKYIEHVGLTGGTVRGATRSIVADGWLGRLVSLTLLHEPFHGVHHQQPGLTHAELPARRAALLPTHESENAPFPSYRHALMHLLRNLADPRVGPQWR